MSPDISPDNEIDKCVETLLELMINMIKSDRKTSYSTKKRGSGYRQMNETPLTVGLGLHLYKSTRSKVLIEYLSNLNRCISHDKVLKIENSIANAVSSQKKSTYGVYVPPNTVPGIPVHFTIDSCDFKNDTPDRKNKFHAKAQVIIQKSDNCGLQQHLSINRSVKKFKSDAISTEKITKPTIFDKKFSNFDGEITCIEQNDYRELDRTWALCQVMDEDISGVL